MEEKSEAELESLGARLREMSRVGAWAGVERLLAEGAPVGSLGPDGRSALHMACARGERAVVAALLQGGADPNQPTAGGASALGLALEMGGDEIAVGLLKAGADPHGLDQWGTRALRLACERACPEAIKALLAAGAAPNDLGEKSTHGALSALTRERWMWEQNSPRGEGSKRALESARALLAAGADPLRRDEEGRLPSESARALPWGEEIASLLEAAAAEREAQEIARSTRAARAGPRSQKL